MADVERIDRICDKLKELWKFYPDLRLSQLFENFVMMGSGDFFYQKDSVSEKNIDNQIKIVKDIFLEKDKEMLDTEYDSLTEFIVEFFNGEKSKF